MKALEVPTGIISPGARDYAFFVINNGNLTNADGEFFAGTVYEYSCGRKKYSPSTNAVTIVYGGIAFGINSTGDTYLDMYGIGSGSYGRIFTFHPNKSGGFALRILLVLRMKMELIVCSM